MDNTAKPGFWHRTKEYFGLNTAQAATPTQAREAGSGVIPPARNTYANVNEETAQSIGAVSRSVQIISGSVSQMDLAVYRDGIELKTPALIKQPNVNDSAAGFIKETTSSMAIYGNAYWRVYRNAKGEPINLEVLDPNKVTVTKDDNTGKVHYWIGAVEVPKSQIQHLRLTREPGKVLGAGPIQKNAGEIRAALLLRDYANNWFTNSGAPSSGLYLTTEQDINAQEAQELSDLLKVYAATNATPVLSKGLKYESTGLKPSDAQYLEVQQAMIVNIARIFGVPAMHLLAELTGTSNTYLNLEQANIVYLQTTLVDYMREIEGAFSALLPGRQEVRFKEEGLLRMDSVTKWQVTKLQAEVGYTDGNELRKAEGKAPLPQPANNPQRFKLVEDKPNSDGSSDMNDGS